MTVYLRLTDKAGEGLDLVDYEDLRVHPCMYKCALPHQMSLMKSLEYNEGDVIICSYPKSGTHWMTNLVHFTSVSKSVDTEVSVEPVFAASFNLNLIEMSSLPVVKTRAIRKIIATHFYHDRLPTNYLKNGGKIIFLIRNPKDVAVSFFYMLRNWIEIQTKISWEAYLTCFLTGLVPYKSYFDYLEHWQTVIQEYPDQILVVYYEDLKKNCLSELKKIQEHLGYNKDDDRLKEIVEKCSLECLKSNVNTGKVKSNLVTKDRTSALYRKGEIGDWMNHLTVAQNEEFDKVIERRLKHSMFKFQYK